MMDATLFPNTISFHPAFNLLLKLIDFDLNMAIGNQYIQIIDVNVIKSWSTTSRSSNNNNNNNKIKYRLDKTRTLFILEWNRFSDLIFCFLADST